MYKPPTSTTKIAMYQNQEEMAEPNLLLNGGEHPNLGEVYEST